MKFTREELESLLAILDFAVKAGGLSVANTALPLALKIQDLVKQAESQKV